MGALYALFGLIFGAIVSLLAMAGASFANAASSGSVFGMGGVGALAIIVFPILYGVLGFVFGLLGAWLFNVVAGVVGGLEIEGVQTQAEGQ